MPGPLSVEDYQTLLRILAPVPEPDIAQGALNGLYLIDDGNEAQLVGDEVSYLNLIRTMLGILHDTQSGQHDGEYSVYPASDFEGVFVSNAIQGEVSPWHSQVNLMAMYVTQDRRQMKQVGKALGWYRDDLTASEDGDTTRTQE